MHDSPLKKFALVRGSLGLIGSGLAKTGNPDFLMPALIMTGISGGIGLLSVSNSHLDNGLSSGDVWAQWAARLDRQRDIVEQPPN